MYSCCALDIASPTIQGACLLFKNKLFLINFLSGGMIVPRYISMATGEVICSIGQPSTLSTRIRYLWL